MFFKKKVEKKKEVKNKISVEDPILNDRLYDFTNKVRKISENKDFAGLLARQLSRLIKAEKF